jgi:hypothetical protein
MKFEMSVVQVKSKASNINKSVVVGVVKKKSIVKSIKKNNLSNICCGLRGFEMTMFRDTTMTMNLG